MRQLYTKFTFIQQCDMASDHSYNQVHYVQVQGTAGCDGSTRVNQQNHCQCRHMHSPPSNVSVLCTNLETRTRFVQYAETACVV